MQKLIATFSALVLSTSVVCAQTSYDSPGRRAAPPRFEAYRNKPVEDVQQEQQSQQSKDGAAVALAIIGVVAGYCIFFGCSSKDSPSEGDSQTWQSKGQQKDYYFEPAPRPAAEPPPSYTAPIGGERGHYGSDHGF